jgi:hypothetical protein
MPNCTVQKWTLNGALSLRVVSNTAIPANTELSYNYFYALPPPQKIPCRCGASNCSGLMGRPIKKPSLTRKKTFLNFRQDEDRPPEQPEPYSLLQTIRTDLIKNQLTLAALPHLDTENRPTHSTMHAWLTTWAREHSLTYNDLKHNSPNERLWILSSTFYSTLTTTNNRLNARIWSKHIDIKQVLNVYIPILLPQSKHWLLAVLDTDHHSITLYDPQGIRHPEIHEALALWWELTTEVALDLKTSTRFWKRKNPKPIV